jgi:hypothetical protein
MVVRRMMVLRRRHVLFVCKVFFFTLGDGLRNRISLFLSGHVRSLGHCIVTISNTLSGGGTTAFVRDRHQA